MPAVPQEVRTSGRPQMRARPESRGHHIQGWGLSRICSASSGATPEAEPLRKRYRINSIFSWAL